MRFFVTVCDWCAWAANASGRSFVNACSKPSKRNWYESLGWLGATLLGGLLPLWGSYMLFWVRGPSPSFGEFVRHGEFALYSASLLAAAFFLVLREWQEGFFPFRMIFGMVTMAALLLSAIIFAGVFEANRTAQGANSLNMPFLVPFSIGLYVFTLALCFLITLIDMVGFTYEPQEVQAEEIAELASDFHALKDE
jgi:hypothetical protein